MSLIVNENKTSALKEVTEELCKIWEKEGLSYPHDTLAPKIEKVIRKAIHRTQEVDNILMKKDADTIHNQRIELLKLQSKIKELKEQSERSMGKIAELIEEKVKNKSETIRKVEEMIDKEIKRLIGVKYGFLTQLQNYAVSRLRNLKQQLRRL